MISNILERVFKAFFFDEKTIQFPTPKKDHAREEAEGGLFNLRSRIYLRPASFLRRRFLLPLPTLPRGEILGDLSSRFFQTPLFSFRTFEPTKYWNGGQIFAEKKNLRGVKRGLDRVFFFLVRRVVMGNERSGRNE